MTIQDTFATNVRRYRKKAHLSQEKLAELSGLHRTYIGGIEQRRINVSLKNIGRIATALNVDPAVLFLDDSRQPERKVPAKTRSAAIPHPANTLDQLSANSAAVVVWAEEGVSFHPVETSYLDLTIHVLVDLIKRGYTGSELVDQYKIVTEEIVRFLSDAVP